MIYRLTGVLTEKREASLILQVGGIAFRIAANQRTLAASEKAGREATFFSHLRFVEGGTPELYGFLSEEELQFFEQLVSISGIGPKSALSILDVAELGNLKAAITENRPDLLARASGVGAKTAARIVLELKSRIVAQGASHSVRRMEGDADLAETLMTLGYTRDQAERALAKVDPAVTALEARIKEALKALREK